MKIVKASSGHSKFVAGAIGLVKEVEQARKILDITAKIFNEIYYGQGKMLTFHDDTSKTQKANINTINTWHSNSLADKHISFHLNSSGSTVERPIGVETLYRYQADKNLAAALSSNISYETGLKNRGAKVRTDLGFLNKPNKLLLECYFVNSKADVKLMDEDEEIYRFARTVAVTLGVDLGLKVFQPNKVRIKSGQYKSEKAMQDALEEADKIGLLNMKWIQQLKADNGQYYFVTGVYKTEVEAKKVVNDLLYYNVLSKAHIVSA